MRLRHVIVVYDDLLAPGGVPYETRALIGGLLANGCEVTALCERPGGETERTRTEVAVIADFERVDDSVPFPTFGYGLRSLTALLRAEERSHTVFFLIGCRRLEYLAYARLIRRFAFRYVLFPHGLLAPDLLTKGWNGRTKHWLRRQIESAFQFTVDRPVLQGATIVRALSTTEAARLRSLGAKRVFECADGVDRSWLVASAPAAPAPREPLRLLYLGRPEPFQKGIDILLQAIDGLDRQGAVELVLAGPDEDRFRRIVVETLGRAPDWVTFAGMLHGKAKWRAMAEAHLLAHVSRFEGMAKCVREAAARGLPILASYESNFGNWVQSSGAGLATHAAVAAVRDALVRATLLTPDEWDAMREAAWRFAGEHSWNSVAARILGALESQVDRSSRS